MCAKQINQFSIFANLPDDEIDFLEEHLQEFQFKAGDIVFTEDSLTEYFYLILDGEVEIIKSLGTADERIVALSKKETILGEMSMFSRSGTHTASARAHTPIRLFMVPFSQFEALLHRQPEIAYNLLRLYCHRLEDSESHTIADLREKNRQLTLAYLELQAAQAAMIEKEKLEHELRMASDLQNKILPDELPSFPGLDFGAIMIPAKKIGGDFYDFIELDDDQIGIVVGDVCDKGMPAALFMALTYSAIRIEAFRNDGPGDTLRAINQHLFQINHSDMFVTLLYGILNCRTRMFNYARAGHPKPLLLDGRNQAVGVPISVGQPIGIIEKPQIDQNRIYIPPQGTLLIYSDGLSETIEDNRDSPTLPQLCSDILNGNRLNAQALCDHLWRTVGGTQAESLIKDDFTVVVVRA